MKIPDLLCKMPDFSFPPVKKANKDGLLAIGGNLAPHNLLMAYKSGIFPWYEFEGQPVWFFPPERMVVFPYKEHVSHSMKILLKRSPYDVWINRDTPSVIAQCAQSRSKNGQETWISSKFISNYTLAASLGLVHSVSVWQNDLLIGGLYGLAIGNIFCGESMFSLKPDVSKLAFIKLCHFLWENDYELLDCQTPTKHLQSLGAEPLQAKEFEKLIALNVQNKLFKPCWEKSKKI